MIVVKLKIEMPPLIRESDIISRLMVITIGIEIAVKRYHTIAVIRIIGCDVMAVAFGIMEGSPDEKVGVDIVLTKHEVTLDGVHTACTHGGLQTVGIRTFLCDDIHYGSQGNVTIQ
jgi:hypothetical protein